MPCIYFTNRVLGRPGSGFLMYKYSAICLSTPIKKLYRKDTACYNDALLKTKVPDCGGACLVFSLLLLLN